MLPICKLTTAKSCKGQFVGVATFKKFTRRSATTKHVCEAAFGSDFDEKIRKWINSNIKLNRLAEVNDIMGAVVFLSSDASNMVTGSSLMIDGGWTAG